ncbi:MAG: DUF1361 domain-containing protein [Bifidobacteriaceae bacterium]|jgi:uncharacterized membrane protein|nr:DUF1361 domain-containing protein [Bifidobacteriaceae bacterium]MCI1915201.1 DUF1361 domain-containing protein [Bifidobacteriaceae bacterium]
MLGIAALAFVGLQLWTALLIVLRGLVFHTKIYRPMLWNLFLSLAPLLVQVVFGVLLLFAVGFINSQGWGEQAADIIRVLMVLWLVLWALMFPNATYLITELNFSHRRENDPVPLYYDIVLVFSLALTGFINALASLSGFQGLLILAADSVVITPVEWAIVFIYILASAFALYLGREVRVNSWDVLHPIAFIKKLGSRLHAREEWHKALGYTLSFAGLLTISHLLVFSLLYSALLG